MENPTIQTVHLPRINNEGGHSSKELLEISCQELLKLIVQRDEAALTLLYKTTISRVFNLALRITGSPQAAEDVIPEVYLKVWRDAGQFDLVRGRALTWLLVICRSRSLDYLRRCDEAEPHPNPTSLVAEALCDIVNPEDMTMLLERDHAISDALVKLLPIQRQLVVLSFFRGYSHLEMARYTHIPLGTVKTHIRNALMSMKNSMSQWHTDGA